MTAISTSNFINISKKEMKEMGTIMIGKRTSDQIWDSDVTQETKE